MKNTNKNWEKIFLGFGILTILSGIYLVLQQDYLIGISGSIVGVWLFSQNWMKIKEKEEQ